MLNIIFLQVFPYVALVLFVVVSIYLYKTNSYKFSSLSSEFLESKQLFWGSVPWHYGILIVLLGHLIGFMFPESVIAFGAIPVRLLILEIVSLIFGLMALFGLCMLIHRRMTNAKVRAVTTSMDVVVLMVLLAQVVTGVLIAINYRWGSAWYASALTPYLKSIFLFSPDISYIESMPFLVKLHAFNAFLIVALIPFSRFVHFLVVPVHYLWRSYQIVIWNWDRKRIRKQ